jgi:hypothetical protein
VAATLILSVDARDALRAVRPVARVVLEDVALDAVWQDSRLVAATSARRVAEHLGLDTGTAASALRVLRERGLLELTQRVDASGRFALAGYTLHLPAGIEVKPSPCGDRPHPAEPDAVQPDTVAATAVGGRRHGARPSSGQGEQGTFDLGPVRP